VGVRSVNASRRAMRPPSDIPTLDRFAVSPSPGGEGGGKDDAQYTRAFGGMVAMSLVIGDMWTGR
jgi:hypothetical protein